MALSSCCRDSHTRRTSPGIEAGLEEISSPHKTKDVSVSVSPNVRTAECQTSDAENTDNAADVTETQDSVGDSGRVSVTGGSPTSQENSVPNSPASDQSLVDGRTGNSIGVSDKQRE